MRVSNHKKLALSSPDEANRVVFGVLKNVIRERRRERRCEKNRSQEARLEERLGSLADGTRRVGRVQWQEIRKFVTKSFGGGSLEAEVFVLRYDKDLKIREIAIALDRPRSTVQDALNRVHRAVKEFLS